MWLWGWVKIGFAMVKNPDLWQRLLLVYPMHNVRFVWVNGHAGNPENERCDQLAVQAASSQPLLVDAGYEAGEQSTLDA